MATAMDDAATEQRNRREELFRQLVATGVRDVESLRVLRGDRDAAATSAWVRAQGDRLLSVWLDSAEVYPAFQFDERGELRVELREHVEALRAAGMKPLSTWSWLVFPTGRLSGGVPADMVVTHPVRAARAVQRMVDELRGPGTG